MADKIHRALQDPIGVVPSTKVVVASADDSVSAVIASMTEACSDCAIIWDKDEKVAFIDWLDILMHISKVLNLQEPSSWNALEATMNQIQYLEPCIDLISKSIRQRYAEISGSVPIQNAIHILETNNIHRIALVDLEGQLVSVTTTASALTYVLSQLELSDLEKQTGSAARAPQASDVQCADENDVALNAFMRMHRLHLDTLGVTNSQGMLVGSISTTDLYPFASFSAEMLRKLAMPLRFFMQHRPFGVSFRLFFRVPKSAITYELINSMISQVAPLVVAAKETSIAEVVSYFRTPAVRVAYIVDRFDKRHPIGQISAMHVLSLFSQQA